MNTNQDLNDLFVEANLISADLIKNVSDKIYGYEKKAEFNNVEFPILDIEILAEEVISLLVSQNRVPQPVELIARKSSMFRNETLGLVLKHNPNVTDNRTKFVIRIKDSLNTCWSRFVLLKEICQIYIDQEKDIKELNTNLESQVYDLLEKQGLLNNEPNTLNLKPNDENYTEFLSFFTAINLIFPNGFRSQFKELISPVIDGQGIQTYPYKLYDLASIYKMPEYITKFFLKEIEPVYDQLGI